MKKYKSGIFTTIDGLKLIIKYRRSAVIFYIDKDQAGEEHNFLFQFTPKVFKELLEYIELIANKSWKNVVPKEANSFGSDYCEYYDKKFDNNGYLDIEQNSLYIGRPTLDSNKLYQFNKRKMESFIFDLKSVIQ